MKAEAPVNSLAWWENYFAAEWERHGGTGQTRHFMQRLLEALPALDRALLAAAPLSILDWGCALGDGCAELAEAFPLAQITGLDAADAALTSARARFPKLTFERAALDEPPGTLPREFDVVFNSNSLEHFANPLDVLRANLARTKLLHVSLVPYGEDPLSVHHVTRFDEDAFPRSIDRFARLFLQVIDVDPKFWPSGKQLLVGYASAEYARQRAAFAPVFAEQQKWEKYYGELPLVDVDPLTRAFGEELVAALREILPSGARVLEAGCGGGQQSLALARAGFDVTLLDFSEHALDYARRLFEREGAAATFVRADAFAPGRPEFDLVFNAGVLEHYDLAEQARFLRGMASRSRGYVLALIPNRACYWYWVWRIRRAASSDWPFGKEVPQISLADAFEAAGLEHLGECYLGASWTEYFIDSTPGLDDDLKRLLLDLHRSPVIPALGKGYLTAALGRVRDAAGKAPSRWQPAPSHVELNRTEERWTALLADALAGKIAADERARDMPRLLDERAQLQGELAKTNYELAKTRDDLARTRDDFARTRDQLAQAHSETAQLRVNLGQEQTAHSATRTLLETTRSEAHAARSMAAELRSQLQRVADELNSIRWSRGYRLLQLLYRVRLRLLPRGSRREAAARAVWRFARALRHRRRLTALVIRAPAASGPTRTAPHAGIRLLKEIEVEVIDRDFAAGSVRTPFSLVTTIKNEAAGIVEFLASIERQSVVPDEVIIVDGGSTDGTIDLVADFRRSSRLEIHLSSSPGANIAQGRNRGIDAARNELLVLTDAGCRLDPDFCKNLVGCLEQSADVDLASGICLPLRGSEAHFIPEWGELDWSEFLPSARSLAVRRSNVQRIGGFPEYLPLTGEDTLFDVNYRRASRKWVFNRRSLVHWDAPSTEEAARRLAFSYGKGDGESGIGDYRYAGTVCELVRQYPYGKIPVADPVWREFYLGYLDGRSRRAEIEIKRRQIRGVVLVLSAHHIASEGNRDTDEALELLARGFKVVFVNAQPYAGRPRWFDIDYTLLELYSASDFNWEECLSRYAAISERMYALYPAYHPLLGSLVERLKAKTGNRLKFGASIDEIERDVATLGPPSQSERVVSHSSSPVAAAARATNVLDGAARQAAAELPGRATGGGIANAARTFLRISRRYGVKEAVRRTGERLARVLPRGAAPSVTASTTPATLSRFCNGSSYDLVSFPIMPWTSRFQRSQQLLTRFAAHGTRIFRIDRGFLLDDAQAYAGQEVHPNVLQVTLGASRQLNIYADAIDNASLERMLQSFEAIRAEWQVGNAVCIVELPFWYPLAKELRARYGWEIVYDCMDEHEGFSTNEGQMVSQESELARDAALVVVTSQYLERKMESLNSRRALIRNATDFEHFSRRPAEDRCRGIRHPIIGYYGAISEWFDQELVAHAATKLEHCSFVLIGGNDAGGSLAILERLPNVRLLGEQPYADLPKYLHSFDVCIIPFKLGKLMEATNPVKFYEYLSAGKPVVSVPLPELFPYREHLYLADGKDAFVDKINQALAESSEDVRRARIALARDNTWEVRYQAFRGAIDALSPEVSIIVVTYGNLDITKRCIDSVFARSQYPRFEVIVVDNGSSDGTPEYLRGLAARNQSVKIILNPDNKGFAAANNQGLAIARGEIVVLLNNDTVVTPGWISKLTRYLKDEAIGMVGPATNMCGNESIIHVPYDMATLTGLDEFVQRYYQVHPRPDAFDIDMLAMFCVAMRRKTVDEIGPLDERFGIGMFEDTDYAERLKRAGYRIVSARDVFIHHDCKSSFGKLPSAEYMRIYEENRRKFEEKWERRSQY